MIYLSSSFCPQLFLFSKHLTVFAELITSLVGMGSWLPCSIRGFYTGLLSKTGRLKCRERRQEAGTPGLQSQGPLTPCALFPSYFSELPYHFYLDSQGLFCCSCSALVSNLKSSPLPGQPLLVLPKSPLNTSRFTVGRGLPPDPTLRQAPFLFSTPVAGPT